MSLKFQTDPVEDFIKHGQHFLQAPSVIAGMAFDDALVKLKRHALSALKDEELAIAIGRLGPLVRNQDMESLRAAFDAVAARFSSSS